MGPLGVFVKDGTVTVDRDGDPDTTGAGEDAEFGLGIADNDGDGRHYLRDGLTFITDLTVTLEAGASASLPLCFPTPSVPVGTNRDDNRDGHPDNELVVDIPSLPDLFNHTGFPVHLTTPDLAGLMSDFNVCDLVTNASVLLDGLDALLGVIQDGLQSEVLGRNFPLVGDKLATAGDFIQEFREGLLADIRARLATAGDPVGLVKEAFWSVLGQPDSTCWSMRRVCRLPRRKTFRSIASRSTARSCSCSTSTSAASRHWWTRRNPIRFDIGIPGLGLSVDGNVKVEIGFTLNLLFGISSQDGFYFDTNGAG